MFNNPAAVFIFGAVSGALVTIVSVVIAAYLSGKKK